MQRLSSCCSSQVLRRRGRRDSAAGTLPAGRCMHQQMQCGSIAASAIWSGCASSTTWQRTTASSRSLHSIVSGEKTDDLARCPFTAMAQCRWPVRLIESLQVGTHSISAPDSFLPLSSAPSPAPWARVEAVISRLLLLVLPTSLSCSCNHVQPPPPIIPWTRGT